MALVSEGASAKNLGMREGDLIFAAPDSTAWWACAPPRKYSARRFKQNDRLLETHHLHEVEQHVTVVQILPRAECLYGAALWPSPSRAVYQRYLRGPADSRVDALPAQRLFGLEAAFLTAKGGRERLIFRDLAKTTRGRAPRSREDRAVTGCQGAAPG
jgi:hypothetical protein